MGVVSDQLAIVMGGAPQLTKFQDFKIPNFPELMVVQATMNEVTNYSAETTDNPVEGGFDITDHMRVKPVEYQIDGVISETPLGAAAQIGGLGSAAAAAVVGGFKGGIVGSAVTAGGGAIGAKIGGKLFGQKTDDGAQISPLKAARDIIRNILVNRQIVRIVTKHDVFESMVFTSVTFTRDGTTGQALKFSIRAKQIKTVTAQTIILDNVKSDAAHSAGEKQKEGTKTPVEKNASILLKSGRAIGAMIGFGAK